MDIEKQAEFSRTLEELSKMVSYLSLQLSVVTKKVYLELPSVYEKYDLLQSMADELGICCEATPAD